MGADRQPCRRAGAWTSMPKSATTFRRGATVVLDTSGPALRPGCAARPFLVKPNVVEAEEFTGQPLTLGGSGAAAARPFLEAGAQNVILSWARTAPSSPGGGESTCNPPPSPSRRLWAPATRSWPAPCGRCSKGCLAGGPVGRHHRHPSALHDDLRSSRPNCTVSRRVDVQLLPT